MRDKIERLEKLGLTLHKSESGKNDFYAKKGVAFYLDTLESMTEEEFEKKLSRIKPEPILFTESEVFVIAAFAFGMGHNQGEWNTKNRNEVENYLKQIKR